MRKEPGKLRIFLLVGGFVFLLTLFVEGSSRRYPHPFFTPLVDIQTNKLPFSITAGVIAGLYFALKKRP